MKIKNLFVTLGLALALGVGTAVGLGVKNEVKEAKATTTYYLAGSCAAASADDSNMYGAAWSTTSRMLGIVVGSELPVAAKFYTGDQFKYLVNDSWDGALGFDNTYGTAAGCFHSEGGNVCCHVSGTYDLYISGTTLYIDFQDGATPNFYYSGTANEWADLTSKAMTLNGSAVQLTFTAAEEFKVKMAGENAWGRALNISTVNGVEWNEDESTNYAYYRCFSGTDNIYVRYAGTYDVRVITSGHLLKIDIQAHDAGSNTAYVLDLCNNRLHVTRHAHYYNATIQTTWPGVDLGDAYSGHIYRFTYWDVMTKVIFTNDGSNQTAEQTLQANKVFVLQEDWSGVWVSMEAATFIESKMRFAGEGSISTSNTTKGTTCKGFWGDVLDAYNDLSANSVRLEVLSVSDVNARLSAWAEANGATLDTVNGAPLSSVRNPIAVEAQQTSNFPIVIVVVVSSIALLAIAGYFMIRGRKED